MCNFLEGKHISHLSYEYGADLPQAKNMNLHFGRFQVNARLFHYK